MSLRSLIAVTIALAAARPQHSLHAQTQASAVGAGDAAAIYRTSSSAVFLVEIRNDSGTVDAIGSAFLIAPTVLVTNAHVVQGGRPFLKTGAVALPLTVERLDPAQDLAVLRSATPLEATPLRLASQEPAVGSPIFVLGNPQGLERSISEGIVSGARIREGRRLMQVTAPISPGSSGGPVLLQDGTVVGVTVGYLEGGQNLNFAIPVAAVRSLLAGPVSAAGFPIALAAVREQLVAPEPASGDSAAWAERTAGFKQALQTAAAQATTGAQLLQVAVVADSAAQLMLAAEYAQAAMQRDPRLADSARAVTIEAWNFRLVLTDSTDVTGLHEMLAMADSQLAHRPRDPEALVFRAQALETLGRGAEAITAARKAVAVGTGKNMPWYWTVYHRVVGKFGRPSEDDAVFAQLVKARAADAFDWGTHAQHLRAREQWVAAGDAYAHAYQLTTSTKYSRRDYPCEAGRMWTLGSLYDKALDALRACVDDYSRTGLLTQADTGEASDAHRMMASILNERNVFTQGEVHARQARVLDPTNPWAALALSRAYQGEQRPTEAAAAAEEAIRLSDGRYSEMHFQAGSAYFELQDWSRCAQAYMKAAELEPKDDAAAYNTGLCLAKQGYYRDAARWMEQALVRNPHRADRADIQHSIAVWRQ